MNGALVDTLLRKGLICAATVVTAKIGVRNRLGGVRYSVGDYTITESKRHDQSWRLTLCSVIGRSEITATDGDIVAIDGMSVDRFADVYNINSDGTEKKMGKKRGRKPKNIGL